MMRFNNYDGDGDDYNNENGDGNDIDYDSMMMIVVTKIMIVIW